MRFHVSLALLFCLLALPALEGCGEASNYEPPKNKDGEVFKFGRIFYAARPEGLDKSKPVYALKPVVVSRYKLKPKKKHSALAKNSSNRPTKPCSKQNSATTNSTRLQASQKRLCSLSQRSGRLLTKSERSRIVLREANAHTTLCKASCPTCVGLRMNSTVFVTQSYSLSNHQRFVASSGGLIQCLPACAWCRPAGHFWTLRTALQAS
jgi:hypothetical protein